MALSLRFFYLCLLLIPVYSGACSRASREGPGASANVAEARDRGVLVCTYRHDPSGHQVGMWKDLVVRSAFLEHQWGSNPDSANGTQKWNLYQFIVEIEDGMDLRDMSFSWKIGDVGATAFRIAGRNYLIADIDSVPASDTVMWNIVVGQVRHFRGPFDTVGVFTLVRDECME